jgi:hypothetical protein
MTRVADHLKLSEGASPTIREFCAVVRELRIEGWSDERVGKAFRRSYKEARKVYEGEKAPATVEQEAIVRAQGGKQRAWETTLEAPRIYLTWLDAQPREVRERPGWRPYSRFAAAYNRRAVTEGRLLLPRGEAISIDLAVSWELALAVARNVLSLDEARSRHRQATDADPGPLRLIGRTEVAEILGLHREELTRLRAIKPVPVAATISNQPVWFRDDIRIHASNREPPEREEGWMQQELVDVGELAARRNVTRGSILSALSRNA